MKEQLNRAAISILGNDGIKIDENGRKYYIANGKKCYPIDCKTEYHLETSKAIMRYRMSGCSKPSDML